MTNQVVLLRRRHALTQRELARLIGSSQASICRLEAEEIDRTHHLWLDAAFGLHVVFGIRPEKLFRALFSEVEDDVMRNVAALDRDLDGDASREAEHKRALFRDILRRAGNRPLLP